MPRPLLAVKLVVLNRETIVGIVDVKYTFSEQSLSGGKSRKTRTIADPPGQAPEGATRLQKGKS